MSKKLDFDLDHNWSFTMPAMETFDWFKSEMWPQASEQMKTFLSERRSYLLTIRNENERYRLIQETIVDVKAAMKKQKN